MFATAEPMFLSIGCDCPQRFGWNNTFGWRLNRRDGLACEVRNPGWSLAKVTRCASTRVASSHPPPP